MDSEIFDALTHKVIGCALEVHRILGPGLLESVYENALCRELDLQHIPYLRQYPIQVKYKDVVVCEDFKADLIVSGQLVVELKSVENMNPVFYKQTLTYMRLLHIKRGLLINFNEVLLKNGIKRIVD